jgi:VCBS repeat-containing protein
VLEGGTYPLLPPLPQLGATDADTPSILLSFVLSTPAAHGLVTVYPDGTFTYVHDGTENFSDSFIFTVSDEGFLSSSATVTINVTPVNDPPVVDDEYFSVDEGGTLLEQLVGLDPDDVDLDFEWVTLPSNGSLVVDPDGSITYVHFGEENIFDSFTYRAFDGEAYSNVATVYITVNPVNDPPVANDDGFTVLEGGVHNGQLTGTDPDTLEAEWTYALVTTVVNGTLVLDPDGSYIYTHNGSETTTDSFTFTITDGALLSNTATITIDVTPVNDPPVATGLAFTLLQGTLRLGTLSASDPDDTLLTYALVTGPVYGTVIINANGTFS